VVQQTRHKGQPAKRISINLLAAVDLAIIVKKSKLSLELQKNITYSDVVNYELAKALGVPLPDSTSKNILNS